MNHNVKLTLHYSLWENFSASVRSGDILSAYLYLLTKDNSVVGYVQGVNGVVQLLAALPAGILTDRYRRDAMLRVSALLGLLAGLFFAATLLLWPTVWAICAAMAALGCYRGFYNPPLESIFADSVLPGRSSSLAQTRKYITTVLASGCGPLLSLALFYYLGNQWETADCRHVLLWGLGLMAVPLGLLCFFDDGQALGHHEHTAAARLSQAAKAEAAAAAAAAEEGTVAAGTAGQKQRGRCCRVSPGLAVTVLISVSDFCGALASGMTLKFFAMFFMQACKVSPAMVSLLGALSPLCISAASMMSHCVSHAMGRVQLSILTRGADVALLVGMAYFPTNSHRAIKLLMVVHLLRMALANCTRPLMRSVLMDHVERRHRGKVNAVDSVRTFSWSGSAALGGTLIERFGFQTTFLITAAIKLSAIIPLLFLIRYVHDGWLAGGQAPLEAGYLLLPEPATAEVEGGHENEEVPGSHRPSCGVQHSSRSSRARSPKVVDSVGELAEPFLGQGSSEGSNELEHLPPHEESGARN